MSEETEIPKAPAGWKRILGKAAKIFVIALVIIFLMGFLGISWPIEFAFHLIVGPFLHSWKNLPPFFSQWHSALLPLACLAIAVIIAHRFIRWWINTKEINIAWRVGHSVAAALLILLGSAAAIAMSGITHQAAWLVSSPWLESNQRSRQVVAVHNARQILLALHEYEIGHGRYPDTLDEAVKTAELPARLLWVETGPNRLREPFIFLKPGRPSSGVVEPVLVSPFFQTGGKLVVGNSDCSVQTMPLIVWQMRQKKSQTTHE
jgi:type II secretory pathway pseudopilin PulG